MKESDDRIWGKLQEMDNKLEQIQGDTNTQTTVIKEDNRGTLLKLFKRKFGKSNTKMRIWYYADEKYTVKEISEESGLSTSQIYNHTADMREMNLIAKYESGNTARYRRQEITEGIGLEGYVEDEVDDL